MGNDAGIDRHARAETCGLHCTYSTRTHARTRGTARPHEYTRAQLSGHIVAGSRDNAVTVDMRVVIILAGSPSHQTTINIFLSCIGFYF